MPGLNQLKQFNADMLSLGDEVKIRSARGEKPVAVKIPKDITVADDSADFADGLPVVSEEEFQQAEAAAAEREREKYNVDGLFGDSSASESDAGTESAPAMPDLSDILNPDGTVPSESEAEGGNPSESALADDDFDLASFAEPASPSTPVASAINDSAGIGSSSTMEENSASASPETAGGDFEDLGDLADFADSGESLDLSEALPEDLKEEPDPEALAAYEEQKRQEEGGESDGLEGLGGFAPADSDAALPAGEPLPALDESLFSEDLPADENVAAEDDFSVPAMDAGAMPEGLTDLPDFGETEAADGGEGLPDGLDGLSDMGGAGSAGEEAVTGLPDGLDALPDMGGLESLAETGDGGEGFVVGEGSSAAEPVETLEASDDGLEAFDTSGMDGVDFDAPVDAGNDFELGNITAEEGNEEFSIPGFSDTVTANLNKKAPEPAAEAEKSSSAPAKPKNTFTDAEYKQFLENLEHYPLNIRLAVELFATKSDFTDDAQFEIFERILKKAPAKQVASELEKMLSEDDLKQLGIQSLNVPKDFERRSNEEWEAYKRTPQYQLKNRILPLAILGTAAADGPPLLQAGL